LLVVEVCSDADGADRENEQEEENERDGKNRSKKKGGALGPAL
jgi:hypothetical protein